ncbi:bifunctional phosphopantothenoylcysteine decarboxylase/phosphopantothenate--cysteine ligase CoaBC [Campylobacter sp.]|uniref:bifunctional phosphopantothenoylcysteine decarboxylase/phosphopantothenate--cysteine ligase CoaBC n=1 Tax=Campylobacter sp. TaxID=205 RepID=UPI0026DADFD3|nr:bifunctional phosphopantothenoylcysteine decarboxylase/phosphopantothenate--cysteine ligase CoaBC [Campylobacter sp.]MDO4673964.1 bifunctional phosphopantothenoylcysteine decarboxylase/phosphopantothenate--cysteine ligase CoaBC [Campylobacter sp.]
MKTILLAVSGSIAFYKAYELISLFKKEGFGVKVLLSKGALKFATPASFEALCDALLHEGNESWSGTNNHIAFSKDADVVLLAPASANSINKLAQGIADTLFIQTLLACPPAKLIIAPAANTAMFLHFSTQNSLALLEKNGATLIPPVRKKLACKDEGVGGLAPLEAIFARTKRELLRADFWRGKSVIITGGGTRERIDCVRCVSNFSSGKMAKALADAFYFSGAEVVFLSAVGLSVPYILECFESSQDLKKLLEKYKKADFLVMAAAVSDFVPEFHEGKLKKRDFPKGLVLNLKPGEDLLANTPFEGKKIGFKMEFDAENALENTRAALEEKRLDMICLNILGEKNHFGSEENELYCITPWKLEKSPLCPKKDLAYWLVRRCEGL